VNSIIWVYYIILFKFFSFSIFVSYLRLIRYRWSKKCPLYRSLSTMGGTTPSQCTSKRFKSYYVGPFPSLSGVGKGGRWKRVGRERVCTVHKKGSCPDYMLFICVYIRRVTVGDTGGGSVVSGSWLCVSISHVWSSPDSISILSPVPSTPSADTALIMGPEPMELAPPPNLQHPPTWTTSTLFP
jgi:hypothetical protein